MIHGQAWALAGFKGRVAKATEISGHKDILPGVLYINPEVS